MRTKLLPAFFLMFGAVVAAQPAHVCFPDSIPAATPSARFVDNDDGTVTDKGTDLMWKQCLEGLKGSACDEGDALSVNWVQALLYMPAHNASGFAGYRDWRLPNIRELNTIVETQCAQPAMNMDVFPGALSRQVWSSSPYHFYTHYSWFVDFSSGQPTYDERIRAKSIRLVRDVHLRDVK